MAIINNNVQNVKFLRNGNLFENHEGALTAINNEFGSGATIASDGTAILARYGSGNNVKTLVGFIYFASNESKSLTVLDVEGAHADVEALRTEINNKLGNGIGSGESETVTAQLTALSGGTFTPGTSSSAATSVEGAKAYAKDYTDEQIGNLEYTGVTTGDGKVIVNVTETDGIVSGVTAEVGGLKLTDYSKGSDSGAVATTDTINQAISKLENQIDATNDAIEALDYTDTAATKQFVAAVDETNGVISITRGEIESSGKTIVLTADGNDVNFEVNIDNSTLTKDANGVISVTSSALVQYEGDDDTIQIGAVSDGKRIVSSPLTIQKVTTGLSAEVKEEYHLVGHSGTTIGDPVKIYKDSHIVSITYITDSSDTHYQNLEYKYIDASGNTQTTYVDMSELVLEAEFASGVTITDHVAHGVVDPTSETFLTVGADGFKLSGVQDAINAAVNGLNADVSGNSTHVTVGVVEEDGEITAVTVSESNIANADDLAELSGKTVTAITSTNGSITASIDDAVGNKTYDIITDASKIKMSGFTSTDVLSGITTSSSITEAFEEVDRVITDNELVTSSALNDLNTKIDELSGGSASDLSDEIAARKAVDGINGDAYSANTSANYISAATSLNDADQKLDAAIDNIADNYVSGITVNGSGLTVTNNIAAVTVTPATSATTASGNNAITVDTDANGNITLGISTIDCGFYA